MITKPAAPTFAEVLPDTITELGKVRDRLCPPERPHCSPAQRQHTETAVHLLAAALAELRKAGTP